MEERLHVVFIGVERTERGEILCARVAFRNEVCCCSPGEFRLTVLYSEYVGHHARVAAVSVGKRMDFRNKLVMKAGEAFVEQECLVFQPILNVAEELWNALQNVAGRLGRTFWRAVCGRKTRPVGLLSSSCDC